MACPFLKEAQVKYCRTASVRKLIPLAAGVRAEEKCSSPSFSSCPVYRANPEEEGPGAACPYLHSSLMQFCGAAPVTRFVPYSESLLSRCGNDGYRYCELYLGMAHPAQPRETDTLPVPDWLRYSANHMWLDLSSDGSCHVGIDAFLSRAVGRVDRVSFLSQKGNHRPAAVLTAGGVEFEVMFPNPVLLSGCNLYLRADPGRIAAEPYTAGWLFEGTALADTAAGLIPAPQARDWMDREQKRMSEFLQDGTGTSADGGLFARGAVRLLEHDRMRTLFHEFFSPYASGKEN
jgi:glycine cleavage system H lipoate-binding protein